jgi:hypothetical protein
VANRKEERRNNNNNENRTEAEVLDVAFLREINTKKNKNKLLKDQGNKQQRQERAIRHKRAPMTINHHEIFPPVAEKKKKKQIKKQKECREAISGRRKKLSWELSDAKQNSSKICRNPCRCCVRAREQSTERTNGEGRERGERERRQGVKRAVREFEIWGL